VTQHLDVGDRLPTVGDHHRYVGEHPTPVVHRPEPPPGQRRRQRLSQPNPVGQQPQQHQPGV
jgi:hypothetical protein